MTDAEQPNARITDPLAMRALAHPVRIKLMMALGAGPANVTTLASAAGIPGNQVSFHLRQLEKYGLVRRAERPESATARESWWEVAARSVELGDLETGGTEEQRIEMAGVITALLQNRAALMADALLSDEAEGFTPDDRSRVLESRLRLTVDEANELAGDVAALWRKWGERQDSPAADRDLYLLAIDLFPIRPIGE